MHFDETGQLMIFLQAKDIPSRHKWVNILILKINFILQREGNGKDEGFFLQIEEIRMRP